MIQQYVHKIYDGSYEGDKMQETVLKLSTPRLLAWYKKHRLDDTKCDGYGKPLCSMTPHEEDEVYAVCDFLNDVRNELNKRENVE